MTVYKLTGKKYRNGQIVTLTTKELIEIKFLVRVRQDTTSCTKCAFHNSHYCHATKNGLHKTLKLKGNELSCYSTIGAYGYFELVKTLTQCPYNKSVYCKNVHKMLHCNHKKYCKPEQ